MIEKMIESFLQNQNAEKYLIESVNIPAGTQKITLRFDEVLFIWRNFDADNNYSFYTVDDVFYANLERRRVVQVNGFIIFKEVSTLPIQAYRVTIIEKKKSPQITLIVNENKEITGVKI